MTATTSEATQQVEPAEAMGIPRASSPLANREQTPTTAAEGLKLSSLN